MELVRQFVARAVFIKNGKILLANKKGEPHLFIPGGRVEPSESIVDAVVREIKEELDCKCTIKKYFGSIEHSFNYTDTKKYYEVGHFFEVDIEGVNEKSPKSNEDEMQFSWINIKKLDSLDIRPKPVIELLKKINSGVRFEGFWRSTLKDENNQFGE